MGYTVPVVVRKGDQAKTIGYADVETEREEITGFFIDKGVIRTLESHSLNMSVSIGDVDIEEISIVVNDNPNNKEEQ